MPLPHTYDGTLQYHQPDIVVSPGQSFVPYNVQQNVLFGLEQHVALESHCWQHTVHPLGHEMVAHADCGRSRYRSGPTASADPTSVIFMRKLRRDTS